MKNALYTDAEGQTLCYECVTSKKNRARLLGVRFNTERDVVCTTCGRFIPLAQRSP